MTKNPVELKYAKGALKELGMATLNDLELRIFKNIKKSNFNRVFKHWPLSKLRKLYKNEPWAQKVSDNPEVYTFVGGKDE